MKRLILILLLGGFIYWVGSQLEQQSRNLNEQFFGEIFAEVDVGDEKLIALTLDDGPWKEEYALASLEQFKRYGISVTYFLNGRGMERNMPIVKKMVKQGHQIGNHSYSHSRMYFMLPSTLEHEVGYTTQLIEQSGYEGEILFRPPYGRKLFTLPYYLEKNGYVTATWSIDVEWSGTKNAEELAQKIIDQAKPGAIILLHPLNTSNQQSRDAIDIFVPRLKAMGYQFVTLNELRARGEQI